MGQGRIIKIQDGHRPPFWIGFRLTRLLLIPFYIRVANGGGGTLPPPDISRVLDQLETKFQRLPPHLRGRPI